MDFILMKIMYVKNVILFVRHVKKRVQSVYLAKIKIIIINFYINLITHALQDAQMVIFLKIKFAQIVHLNAYLVQILDQIVQDVISQDHLNIYKYKTKTIINQHVLCDA
jgi:hypothetical protein